MNNFQNKWGIRELSQKIKQSKTNTERCKWEIKLLRYQQDTKNWSTFTQNKNYKFK